MAYIGSLLADGLQAVYDGVMSVLRRKNLEPELKYRLLKSAVDIIGKHPRDGTSLKLGDYMEVRALVSDVRQSNQKLVQQFLGQFTNCEQKNSYFHREGTEFLPSLRVCSGGTHQCRTVSCILA
jgi:hypothetical protein